MKLMVYWVSAALAVTAQAFADDPVTPAPAAATTSQDGAAVETSYLDRVVCKKLAPPTGTMLGARKICRTEREWREITMRSQEDITRRQTFHSSLPGE